MLRRRAVRGWRLSLLALSLGLLAAGLARGSAARACSFALGFRELHDLIPDVVGDCSADEASEQGGDEATQMTANGMLVWRRADNWTAFTDGSTTWINGPCGLDSRPNEARLSWEGGGPCPTPTPSPTPRATPTALPTAPPVRLGPEVARVRTPRPFLALTFDTDGILGATPQTLQVLRERGIHVTFFVTGEFARRYPDTVQQMVADGHELGNHTYSHQVLTHLTDTEIADQLERADHAIQDASGQSAKPLMRAPYGARDARVLGMVAAEGYRSIFWSVDPRDWWPGMSSIAIAGAILAQARPGVIVLQHCSIKATAAALPTILDTLADRGLGVVTVSELLRDE